MIKHKKLSILIITILCMNVFAGIFGATSIFADSYTGNTEPIEVNAGEKKEIILENVTIDATGTGKPAIKIEEGAEVELILKGNNTLKGDTGCAGIEVIAGWDSSWNWLEDESGKVIISGNGNLNVTGGNGDVGGTVAAGAGIGGSGSKDDGIDFGVINISKNFTGTIRATGGQEKNQNYGSGAGIGSGGIVEDWLVSGKINIENGNIIATSNGNGAGIGNGSAGTNCGIAQSSVIVNISNGTINATGGNEGAGIGGGSNADGGIINITGGTIKATGGNEGEGKPLGGAGIGGGANAGVSQIKITGGNIEAKSTSGAAGIGGASNTNWSNVQCGDMFPARNENKVGKITISGSNTVVKAYGGSGEGSTGTFGGAGIGAGYPTGNNERSVAFDIVINNGATVNAYGGYHSQAIGYGYRPTDFIGYGIRLKLDDSINLWALNADNYQPALAIKTEDVAPVEYSSNDIYLVEYQNDNRNENPELTECDLNTTAKLEVSGEAKEANWKIENNVLKVNIGEEKGEYKINESAIKASFAVLIAIKPETITVNYELIGTTVPENISEIESDEIEAGSAYSAKEISQVEGYTFDGYYLDEDCTNKFIDGTVLEEDTTLFYKWIKNDTNGDTSDENNPDDNNPDDNTPDDNKPDDNNPDDNTPDDNNPDDNSPDDNTPDDNNSDDNNPGNNTSDDNNTDDNNPGNNTSNDNNSDDNKTNDDNSDDKIQDNNKQDEKNEGNLNNKKPSNNVVKAKDKPTNNVMTGDNIFSYAKWLAGAVIAIAITIKLKRKNK